MAYQTITYQAHNPLHNMTPNNKPSRLVNDMIPFLMKKLQT